MRFSNSFKSIVLFHFIFVLSGCIDKLPIGHFEGNFLTNLGSKYYEEPIKIDITYPSESEAAILITDENKKDIESMHISWTRERDQFLLDAPNFGLKGIKLAHVKEDHESLPYECYELHGDINVELCFNNIQFYFKLMDHDLNPIKTVSGSSMSVEDNLPSRLRNICRFWKPLTWL